MQTKFLKKITIQISIFDWKYFRFTHFGFQSTKEEEEIENFEHKILYENLLKNI